MLDREPCPACGRDAPVEDDEGVLRFKNHPRGFKQGACDAGGDPVDTPPTAYYEDVDVDPEPHVREGHGKPPEARK